MIPSLFLWHYFSYQKIVHLSKDEAYILKNTSKLRASDFDMDDDVYVVDKDFKWTYVKTHESTCGPYFAKCINRVY